MPSFDERLKAYNQQGMFGKWQLDGATLEDALLGTGSYGRVYKICRVVRDSHGKPAIALHGAAARIAEEQGVIDVPLSITYTHSVAVANAVAITKASQAEREKRRDVKAELAQQFKEMRGMLDDLGEQTATSAEAKGAGEPVSE